MGRRQLKEVEAIFHAVVELPHAERNRILDERCGGDGKLRASVERLLAIDDREMGAFLETPASPAEAPPAASDRALPFRIGHYEVVRELGTGGMGVVYEAEDVKLRRAVALKFLSSGALGSEGAMRRFLREARMAAALNHPNVCVVYEVGEVEAADTETGGDGAPTAGTPFIAMERVAGRALADEIESGGAMPLTRLLDLALQVAEGLGAAHARGIVHRDLKPRNVMVAADGRAKILDFGLAKPVPAVSPDSQVAGTARTNSVEETRSEETRHGIVVGTVAYMSPEQAAGKPVDSRSDVFSFGIMLYEMSTGRRPFQEATAAATLEQILEGEPEPPSAVRDDLPAELEHIVHRCLQKSPGDRYHDAQELAATLRELRDQQAGTGVVSRQSRRSRIVLVSTAAAVLVTTALITTWWWSSRHRPGPGKEIRATRLTAVGDMSHVEHRLYSVAMSPDGRTLAYTHDQDLRLASLETDDLRTLVEHEEGTHGVNWVAWHPDGKRVLSEEWYADAGYRIWLIEVATGRREFLFREPEETMLQPSPDGLLLALLRDRRRQLWVKQVRTDSLRLLREVEQGGTFLFSPVWSPSGERLAYMVEHGEKGFADLETCGLDGNRTEIVAGVPSGPWHRGALSWLPDGRLVYPHWTDVASTTSEFRVVNVDPATGRTRDGPRRLFALEGAAVISPTASADGRRLAFGRAETWRFIGLVELLEDGEATLKRVSVEDWPAGFPVWSRDGRRVFFTTERNEVETHIYVRDLEERREKPFMTAPGRSFPQCLTPDGSHLLYWQGQDLMSIPVTGGRAQQLDHMDWRRVGPYPGPLVRCAVEPGSRCVVGDIVGSELIIHELDAEGKIRAEALRISLTPGRTDLAYACFDLSPDGTQLVVTEYGGRIRIVDVESGETRELRHGWPGYPDFVAWSGDGERILISGALEGMHWLIGMTLSGEIEPLWHSRDIWAYAPAPSPDGRYVAFIWQEFKNDVWMIEDF